MEKTKPEPDMPPSAKEAAYGADGEPISLTVRLANLCAVILPLIGVGAAMCLLWNKGFSGVELGLLIGMYMLTVLGITVGFHRLFTHRAFETGRAVQCVLAVLGSMAAQGPLLKWVAIHRFHHRYSDAKGDPHSPRNHGKGVWGFLRGFWYSHIGWFFAPDPADLYNYVKDLRRSDFLCRISALFPLWVALGLMIPALLGGVLTGTWQGAFLGLVWGGLVRMFLVHHVTWSINSVCHIWGGRPFRTDDDSRNNFLLGILALGEGWHNNHHAFPVSARHGLRWWQIDVSYWVICLLSAFGLAKKVRGAGK
jgi:stearoyl-CoA desaturase (delta-9 desaturase)